MPAIALEVAEGMVSEWEVCLGAKLEAKPRARIVAAVSGGRLDFDGEAFAYDLAAPLKLENGTFLARIKIREPAAGELRDAARGGRDEMATALSLISSLSGEPLGVIERLKQRDFLLVAEVLGFFE